MPTIGVRGTFACTLALEPPFAWTLVDEPENPHDPGAVRVDVNGHKVGYIPRELNSTYRATTHQVGVGRVRCNRGQLVVSVDVQPLRSSDVSSSSSSESVSDEGTPTGKRSRTD